VAFISASEEPRTTSLLAAYCRKPVLTISDIEGFANHGGVVGLVEGGLFELIEDDHAVHFTVNRTALYEARLRIGPQRLHLAYPLFSAVSPCGARS
jgi:YfiR/HmsC-like